VEVPDESPSFRDRKKVKKRFGVEWMGPKLHFADSKTYFTWSWVTWKWYTTEKQRDTALVGLIKSVCNAYKDQNREHTFPRPSGNGPRYRKVDR
jgi:hypothetical protein